MVIWNLSKLKTAAFQKDIVKNNVKTCHRLEEIFPNFIPDKGYLSIITCNI